MALASVLADHYYHKKVPVKCKDKSYLGVAKRQLSSRLRSRNNTDGQFLTVLRRKKKYTEINRNKEEGAKGDELEAHGDTGTGVTSTEGSGDVKPEITEITVPHGETFMGLMERHLLESKHEWNVYGHVAAIVNAVTDQNCNVTDSGSVPITSTQIQNAGDSRVEPIESDASSKSLPVPSTEVKFVDTNDINHQFNNPDSTAMYSVVVPEW